MNFKYYGKLIKTLVLIFFFMFVLIGCENEGPTEPVCTHESCTWVWEEDARCNKTNIMFYTCDKCGLQLDQKEEFKDHEYEEETVAATCTTKGYILKTCKVCNNKTKKILNELGHTYKTVIDRAPTATTYGIKHKECEVCHATTEEVEYVANGFSNHGALHVTGVDLMDEFDEKFRLVGISTHGLQWAGQYVRYDTFEALKNEFGINCIRLSLYPYENGYVTNKSETRREELYQYVIKGIEYATELDMYAIVDWHMLGADETIEGDENPLYCKDEAIAFFDRISEEVKDHENVLFEIMNEPSGDTTWEDCKEYAELVIPVIRANMPDAIILVGNPKFSADLESVAKNPLKNVSNIMYTFHFYADDNVMTEKLKTAIGTKHLPVFITEHGGMGADGDGETNETALASWYKVLDKYNLSFVAWNLSNTAGSSSILKTTVSTYDDFSDECLKDWGIIYKKRTRTIAGLPLHNEEESD